MDRLQLEKRIPTRELPAANPVGTELKKLVVLTFFSSSERSRFGLRTWKIGFGFPSTGQR